LVNGYALNKKRLKELHYKYSDLQQAIKLAANAGNIENLTSSEAKGILGVIDQYAYALETLDKYDHQKLTIDSASTEEKIQKLSSVMKLSNKSSFGGIFERQAIYLRTRKINHSKVF